MDWKKWIKQYGVHIVTCGLIVAVAFGVNRKINLDRNHQYTVSESMAVLNKITEFTLEKGTITLKGWGFVPAYYDAQSVRCELILQDTVSNKAVWPVMSKNPATQEIESRYTDGGDYSKGSFEGKVKAAKLDKNKVYEVLLRYTSDYKDENGNNQVYMLTVRTGEFLYQGQMTEYNPETFVAPELAGTELEKELEGARVLFYFPEGMWIYYDEKRIYYIVETAFLQQNPVYSFPLFWHVRNNNDLPEYFREQGKGNNGFYKEENQAFYEGIDNYRIWITAMPSDKVIMIGTGIYNYEEERWILYRDGQIK